VLLKGVNDDFDTLKALFERLIYNGILPYYLNQLDKAEGAAHFEVEIEKGKKLLEQLRASLPGYAIPRYAIEIPGEKISPSYFSTLFLNFLVASRGI